MRVGLTLRFLRATVLAVVVVTFSAAAHTAGGGPVPDPVVLGLLLPATIVALLPLLGRRLPVLATVALVVGGQAFVHELLTWFATATPLPPSPAGHATAAGELVSHHSVSLGQSGEPSTRGVTDGHQASYGGGHRGVGGSGAMGAGMSGVDHAGHGPQMLYAHAVAAAVLGCWLARVEEALWRLFLLLSTVIPATVAVALGTVVGRRPGPGAVLAAVAGPVPIWPEPPRPAVRVGSPRVSRRGPPARSRV